MRRAVRGRLLSFLADPAEEQNAYLYLDDGLLVIEGGRIEAVGDAAALLPTLEPDTPVDHHEDGLILPGLIDVHAHFPQTRVIASYGASLLEWLHDYTFPEERRYDNPDHAAQGAAFFLDELLRNGTTTAAVYCTVSVHSVNAFFAAAEERNLAMIAGKVMMDRGPEGLHDTAQSGYDDSAMLIDRWHRRGRQHYAITPRFALTSSPEQLEAAGQLLKEHPDCHLQTHLAETLPEIEMALKCHPGSPSYTAIYEKHGLLGPRSILGHCVHLSEDERRLLAESRSVAAFCPTSNLFLGSGLFDRDGLKRAGIRQALATDVGGGTSYSMLRTAAGAYDVLRLNGQTLPALESFHAMTLGNARALGMQHEIGTLEPGTAADLVVLDSRATPAMAHRMAAVHDDLEEELFVLATMGDDRAVRATYVMGERWTPPEEPSRG